jgi:hypothetical protein
MKKLSISYLVSSLTLAAIVGILTYIALRSIGPEAQKEKQDVQEAFELEVHKECTRLINNFFPNKKAVYQSETPNVKLYSVDDRIIRCIREVRYNSGTSIIYIEAAGRINKQTQEKHHE